jgi:hypothetical protein
VGEDAAPAAPPAGAVVDRRRGVPAVPPAAFAAPLLLELALAGPPCAPRDAALFERTQARLNELAGAIGDLRARAADEITTRRTDEAIAALYTRALILQRAMEELCGAFGAMERDAQVVSDELR